MIPHDEEFLAYINSRDEWDSQRGVAPLRAASDALLLDTSALDPEQSVGAAVRLAEKQLKAAKAN
jgi:cytidylate kinase